MNLGARVLDATDRARSRLRVWRLRRRGAEIGHGVVIGARVRLEAAAITIGSGTEIGADACLRAREIQLGDMVSIGRNVSVRGLLAFRVGDYTVLKRDVKANSSATQPSSLTLGQNCWIGEDTLFNAQRDVTLDHNVCMARECQVWTHGYWKPEIDAYPQRIGEVSIGRDAWLSTRTIVLAGVTIAAHAIVAPAAVVSESLEGPGFYGGAPARQVRDELRTREPLTPPEIASLVVERLEQALPLWGMTVVHSAPGYADVTWPKGRGRIVFAAGPADRLTPDAGADETLVFLMGGAAADLPRTLTGDQSVTIFDVPARAYWPRGGDLERAVKRILNERVVRFVRAPGP